MAEISKSFPDGLEYAIIYDPTVFISESIRAVEHTIFEATLLVVLVVMVFLQTWRASIIPLVAIPISLIGAFACMAALGFSLNNLSLFGLVLAIGIVVDDAIVVVENIERNIELGKPPYEAARAAMNEVSGPIIAVTLVMAAIFVPDRIHSWHLWTILSPIRPDHCGLGGDFRTRFLNAQPRFVRSPAKVARSKTRLVHPRLESALRLVLQRV